MTVPVGLTPLLTVAVSKIGRADRPACRGVVAIVGVAWVMVTGSAPQAELTMPLLASPL